MISHPQNIKQQNNQKLKLSFILTALILICSAISAQAKPQYYGANLCSYRGFRCITIRRGDTWLKLFPNSQQRELVMRLNRTNVPLRYRRWIVVPRNLNDLNYMDLSPFPNEIANTGKKQIIVDLSKQAFAAYNENGQLIHWGPASGGQEWCDDVDEPCHTVTGDFKIFRKQSMGCQSSKYPVETDGGAPMPYCMHFYKGFAIHGSPLPGYHASHGCVRLFFDDAAWLNESFAKIGTKIKVQS